MGERDDGFMRRWIVHLEWRPHHGGFRFSIRRAPFPGQQVSEGGEHGHLVGCRECSCVGYFFQPEKKGELHG